MSQFIDGSSTHHCQSSYCINEAEYWEGRIVCLGDPGDSIVGWCQCCSKYVCSRCSLKLEIPEAEWVELPDYESLRARCLRSGCFPCMLHCKRCGTLLQKDKNPEILLLSSER